MKNEPASIPCSPYFTARNQVFSITFPSFSTMFSPLFIIFHHVFIIVHHVPIIFHDFSMIFHNFPTFFSSTGTTGLRLSQAARSQETSVRSCCARRARRPRPPRPRTDAEIRDLWGFSEGYHEIFHNYYIYIYRCIYMII